MKSLSSSSLCQILGWSVLVRVDDLTYSFLGFVSPNFLNGTANFTSIAITPTQTMVSARAGPMQVNLTFLNPIEVRFYSIVTFNFHTRVILSPKIGSSNPSHSHTWHSPRTPLMVQVTLSRYIRMSAEVRPVVLRNPSFFSASLQNGTQGIERRRFCGARRPMPMSSSTVSHSSHQNYSPR